MTLTKKKCFKIIFVAFDVIIAVIAISYGWTYFVVPKKTALYLSIFIISSVLLVISLILALIYYKRKRHKELYEEGEGLI